MSDTVLSILPKTEQEKDQEDDWNIAQTGLFSYLYGNIANSKELLIRHLSCSCQQ